MNRYDRQISVAEFGVDGQKKLAAAKILVVGAGAWQALFCNIWQAPGLVI